MTVEQNVVELAAHRHPLSVMIVDDSPVMRNFIRRVLTLSGLNIATVIEASDGNAALEVFEKQSVDLVLSDINMPGMNGEELIREMERDEELSRVPVIVVSTDSSSHRVEMMLGYGARGYIQKPFHPETLRAEVERVLNELSPQPDS